MIPTMNSSGADFGSRGMCQGTGMFRIHMAEYCTIVQGVSERSGNARLGVHTPQSISNYNCIFAGNFCGLSEKVENAQDGGI